MILFTLQDIVYAIYSHNRHLSAPELHGARPQYRVSLSSLYAEAGQSFGVTDLHCLSDGSVSEAWPAQMTCIILLFFSGDRVCMHFSQCMYSCPVRSPSVKGQIISLGHAHLSHTTHIVYGTMDHTGSQPCRA